MGLRKGKPKSILDSSVNSALLAVEVYNKPRATFRSEGFIVLMVIAWTRLFHAYFHRTIGNCYYYKEENGRYKQVDGERKAWGLDKCIKEYQKLESLSSGVEKNLRFSIELRNKIAHRHVDERAVDVSIFGECQALLYNYEKMIVNLFGKEYSFNESLVYTLQFSHLRTPSQLEANKSALSHDALEITKFVNAYRESLTDDEYNSQEYSVKLIQIPKVSNTNRADLAIEFVQWNDLNDDDKEAYEHIRTIIKDRRVKVPVANAQRNKPSEVVAKVNSKLHKSPLNTSLHATLYKLFQIRPPVQPKEAENPSDTMTEFCIYDEVHHDYVYEDAWVDFLVHFFQVSEFTPKELREKKKRNEYLDIEHYRPK